MQGKYKYEVARAMGVTRNTLIRWCEVHRRQLEALGQKSKDKKFKPAALKYVCEVFVIDEEDFLSPPEKL
jgi:transposase-like protein